MRRCFFVAEMKQMTRLRDIFAEVSFPFRPLTKAEKTCDWKKAPDEGFTQIIESFAKLTEVTPSQGTQDCEEFLTLLKPD